jgi:hypothetical protein
MAPRASEAISGVKRAMKRASCARGDSGAGPRSGRVIAGRGVGVRRLVLFFLDPIGATLVVARVVVAGPWLRLRGAA